MDVEKAAGLEPIPQPTAWPVLGNLNALDRRAPLQSFIRLAKEHGPIYRLDLPGRKLVILSSQELVNEACDEQRFDKLISTALGKVRSFSGDGLFTAWTFEPNWSKAHGILMPNFGAKAMQGYLPQMIDIADQLVAKWSRLNPDEVIDVADDMTRLTLDTIGLCGFDYRFNSFYREDPHPFVQAMVRSLGESLLQANRLPLQEALLFRTHRRHEQDIAYMNAVVDRLIQERRADPQAMATKKDLLNYMLTGLDKKTGEGLDDVNIRYQILTFLIAGHETTSGLLSFALYFLLNHPETLTKAYEEVDRVLGTDPESTPTLSQVHQLAYVQQILKESLRLWPTAPAFALYPREETTLGGRFALSKGENLVVLLPMLHRDPSVWGADAEEFRPSRFAPEQERQLPSNAYKPFGNGQRACIGQQFAMQEATLVLGMILRRFEPIDHANYRLRVKETLTLKPDGFTMKVRPRGARVRTTVSAVPMALSVAQETAEAAAPPPAGQGTPLLILYGSNLGTAEGFAQRIAEDGRSLGFSVATAALDDATSDLPREGALIIVTSSYNGAPPDNAARFCDWLQKGNTGPAGFQGVRYAIFGCGDHNWSATYQAIPKLIDQKLAAGGATRLHERGEGDAADDLDGQFQTWYGLLWTRIASALGLQIKAEAKPRAAYRIETVDTQVDLPFVAAYSAHRMTVVASRELQQAGDAKAPERSTRHIELALPDGVRYHTGNHLGVLPRNRGGAIRRVLERFRLDGDSQVIIRRDDAGKSNLPLDRPIRLAELVGGYVELQDPATRDQIRVLADKALCPPDKARLTPLVGDDEASLARYREEVFLPRRSVLDLLELNPSCVLAFEEFLGMLPPLRPRYYSISSSPLINERIASITVAVVRDASRSGLGLYEGVASNYLAELTEGSEILGFVRGPGTPFQPPADPRTPMIMVGAGTGLAPFRGFLQERKALKDRGHDVGPSLLFFGCRNPSHDFLYEKELRDFEAKGLTHLIPAFSRVSGQPKCYVQHSILQNAESVWDLLDHGAVVYVCGDAARLAPDVRAAFHNISAAKTGHDGRVADSWLYELQSNNRYLEDVWASG
ncbi:bifunctional cytochrome P450/NADPH--P450 reductase [Singulisphaera acidiphila]|uniref:Bifunctional cytochrome P450/NADPH--P450 reductase n=1 Tax=Singulisphaera acidiphila (strain ATCC BAA-1392 / DSM 18658 / VKM B-2454 / MOB10) TaxID=886293 RepID=L0DPU7_SINAD|nr:cytochrome P450 [Singulisphaera acidiphila]AGA30711.1 sulfite reductase, alpha subunit (flavoprotein) [Singulisphaera acidiphila DSM 18658]